MYFSENEYISLFDEMVRFCWKFHGSSDSLRRNLIPVSPIFAFSLFYQKTWVFPITTFGGFFSQMVRNNWFKEEIALQLVLDANFERGYFLIHRNFYNRFSYAWLENDSIARKT